MRNSRKKFNEIYRSEAERFKPEQSLPTDKNDMLIILPILLLLMTEKADSSLIFALLYIMS